MSAAFDNTRNRCLTSRLRSISRDILALDLDEGDEFKESEAALSKAIFECSVEI